MDKRLLIVGLPFLLLVGLILYYPHIFDAGCWNEESRWSVSFDDDADHSTRADKFASISVCAHKGPAVIEYVPAADDTFTDVSIDGITEESETVEVLRGYYAVKTGMSHYNDPQPPEPYRCDTLIVTNETALSEYFLDLIDIGNTVNERNSEGYLVLNLYTVDLSTGDTESLVSSTVEKQIDVMVRKNKFDGKGAGPCTSFVTILKVGS